MQAGVRLSVRREIQSHRRLGAKIMIRTCPKPLGDFSLLKFVNIGFIEVCISQTGGVPVSEKTRRSRNYLLLTSEISHPQQKCHQVTQKYTPLLRVLQVGEKSSGDAQNMHEIPSHFRMDALLRFDDRATGASRRCASAHL